MTDLNRLDDVNRFYEILNELEGQIGMKTLAETLRKKDFPHTGMYFFFEPGEYRSVSGIGMRVVRVGIGGKRKRPFVGRLECHRGNKHNKGGSWENSSFRKTVGFALMERDRIQCPTWGNKKVRNKADELRVELLVSQIIRTMPFLWLEVDKGDLKYMEENSIALLSNYNKIPIDLPSLNWLGKHSPKEKVRSSGLWNSDDVENSYAPDFLDKLEELVKKMRRSQD